MSNVKGTQKKSTATRLAMAELLGQMVDIAGKTHDTAEKIESPLLKSTAQALALVMTCMRRSPSSAGFWMLLGTSVGIHEMAAVTKLLGPEMMTHEVGTEDSEEEF